MEYRNCLEAAFRPPTHMKSPTSHSRPRGFTRHPRRQVSQERLSRKQDGPGRADLLPQLPVLLSIVITDIVTYLIALILSSLQLLTAAPAHSHLPRHILSPRLQHLKPLVANADDIW